VAKAMAEAEAGGEWLRSDAEGARGAAALAGRAAPAVLAATAGWVRCCWRLAQLCWRSRRVADNSSRLARPGTCARHTASIIGEGDVHALIERRARQRAEAASPRNDG